MTSDKTPATDGTVQGQEKQIDPADTLTDKDTAAQVDAQAGGDADDGLKCPTCGDWCESLPEGQPRPTPEQLLNCCWVLPDGTQPKVHGALPWGNFCSAELRLKTGLIDSAMSNGRSSRITPKDVIRVDLERAILRLAHRHPLVSTDLVLLLLDRLEDIEFHITRPQDKAPDPCSQQNRVQLCLLLQGPPGVVETLKVRHRPEMLALLKALTTIGNSNRRLLDQAWIHSDDPSRPSEGSWDGSGIYPLQSVLVCELCSDHSWEIPWPPEDTTSSKGGQG